MSEKFIHHFMQMFIFGVLLYACLYIFTSCSSTGTLVSDIGDGAFEYRRIQTQQRDGEGELAVTGAKIEHESKEIRDGLGQLEQSIVASQGTEQEIGNIIQRVREREVDPDFIEEWRNRKTETGNIE